MSALPLLAVPNVSEGRDPASVEAIAAAFTAGGAARLLDVHSDADHHRAVITLAGSPGSLADALAAGAGEAVRRVDIGVGAAAGGEGGAAAGEPRRRGEHPHVGAVDVVPVVYLEPGLRGAACAEALVAAEEIGALGVPVFLYGELAGEDPSALRTRAALRRGGVRGLAERMRTGELQPDFGPAVPHPTAGATLVGARAPLVAFNLELAPPATVEDARRIAGLIREGAAEGLPGVRAIGVALQREPAGRSAVRGGGGEGSAAHPSADSERAGRHLDRVRAQVSVNVERPTEVPLRTVLEAVRAHAAVARAELVGLAPAAALAGFPEDLPMPGFDPARHVIENALTR